MIVVAAVDLGFDRNEEEVDWASRCGFLIRTRWRIDFLLWLFSITDGSLKYDRSSSHATRGVDQVLVIFFHSTPESGSPGSWDSLESRREACSQHTDVSLDLFVPSWRRPCPWSNSSDQLNGLRGGVPVEGLFQALNARIHVFCRCPGSGTFLDASSQAQTFPRQVRIHLPTNPLWGLSHC